MTSMSRLRFLALGIPLAIVLAGCAPESPIVPSGPAPIVSESSTPEPEGPTNVDPAEYLLAGGIGSSTEVWSAQIGFYTDDAKSVRCDITVNSETPGIASCEVVKGHDAEVTYTVPFQITDQCKKGSAFYRGDGYEVALGVFQAIGQDTGFYGCREGQDANPGFAALTKVLPDNATVTIQEFSCSVVSSVASCGYSDSAKSAGFSFSLTTASFHF
jgi:ABC-type transport system substrate-binding protein